jgi:S1-C subfamily serine protease
MVDVEGRLVATISTWVTPLLRQEETLLDPYQFLGKAIPVERLRAAYGPLPEAAELFGTVPPSKVRTSHTAALESSFHQAAHKAYASVVSLEVKRSAPISLASPHSGPAVPRYRGPVSGFVTSPEGWIVTSLYNLANVGTLEAPWWGREKADAIPEDARLEGSLAQIQEITAHLPDGRSLPARLVGRDLKTGTALLKVDAPEPQPGIAPYALPSMEPAPADTLAEGRFVLALGNPFGATRNVSPLLAVGILSKRHPDDAAAPWRGEWQTDAGVTDANCGGAVVDLRGRLVGMLTTWSPARHGRNSGIAFVVPWDRIRAALPDMKAGVVASRGYLGVQWADAGAKGTVPLAVIGKVMPDSAAAKAGLEAGDRIVRVGDARITTSIEALQQIVFAWAGEKVRLRVERGGKELDVEVVLGAYPANP